MENKINYQSELTGSQFAVFETETGIGRLFDKAVYMVFAKIGEDRVNGSFTIGAGRTLTQMNLRCDLGDGAHYGMTYSGGERNVTASEGVDLAVAAVNLTAVFAEVQADVARRAAELPADTQVEETAAIVP